MTPEEIAAKGEADNYFDAYVLPLLEEERRLNKQFRYVQAERLKHQREHLRLTKLWLTVPS